MNIDWAASALDILLAFVQINVAIGTLYAGLPAARYRSKLRDNILRELKRKSDVFKDADVWSKDNYGERLRQVDFQKAHNYLSMWVEEILESQAVVEFDQVVVRFLQNPTHSVEQDYEKENAPRSYRWFKSDWDRKVVVFTTFAPLVLLLVDFFLHQSLRPTIPFLIISIAVGLIAVAVHLWLGTEMVRTHTDKFRNAFGKIETKLKQSAATPLLKNTEQ